MNKIAVLLTWIESGFGLFLVALVSVIAIGLGYAVIDRRSRRRRYKHAKSQQTQAKIDAALPRSAVLASILKQAGAPPWFQNCQSLLDGEDETARTLQRQYHSYVAQCIAVLSAGIIITCVSAIALKDSAGLKKFATDYDLIATLYALACFVFARIKNREFVKQRSCVEPLRAWIHLLLVFPLEQSQPVDEACRHEKARIWSRFCRGARSALFHPMDGWSVGGDEKENAIYRRVEQYWTELQATCRSIGLRPALAASSAGFYIQERPFEQLKFFTRAQDRIHDGQGARETLMLYLYVASVVLAVLKALSVFKLGLPPLLAFAGEAASFIPLDWISTGLLGVMAVSAAATNALVSRNERSLLHSYHAQERRIRRWFETTATSLDVTGSALTADSVINFEDIMFNELLDFIHITSLDVIESPG